MRFICFVWPAVLMICAPALAFAAKPKPCVAVDAATQILNKDICISAHIYDVVQLPDGTRFLDVCSPQTPDNQCRFTVVSLPEDRTEVGELTKYRDANVQIRGIVRPMHGRAGMVLKATRSPVLRRPTKVQAKPTAGPRLHSRERTAASQRSQPAPTGRPPRFHEHQRSGAVAGKVAALVIGVLRVAAHTLRLQKESCRRSPETRASRPAQC